MSAVAEQKVGGDADLSSVARSGLANLAGAVVSAVANFALVLVIARLVSPADAGRFFTVTSLFLVLEAIGRLGADVGLVYFVARWRALGTESRILPGLRAAFVPSAVLCVSAAALMAILAPQLARLIGVDDGRSVDLVRLLAFVLTLTTAYDIALGATRGLGRMRPTVLVEKMGRPALQLLLITVVLATGWTGGLGYAWAAPYVGAFAVTCYLLRVALRAQPKLVGTRGRWDASVAREFWKFTMPRALASVAQVALQRFDIILVASLRGVREAAIYTAATRFLVVGQFVNQAITAPIQPRLSAALSTGDVPRAKRLYQASTAWLVLATWPIFGVVSVSASAYVALFGHDYRSGASVVVVLCIAMLVASGVGLVDSVIIMAGRASWNLATTLFALAVNVGMDLLLIPHLGLLGAALGWFGAIVAANVVPLAIAWRFLGMHPFGVGTLLAGALCGACFVLLPLLGRLVTGGSFVGVAAGLGIGVIGYLVGLWRGRAVFDLTGLLRRGRRS